MKVGSAHPAKEVIISDGISIHRNADKLAVENSVRVENCGDEISRTDSALLRQVHSLEGAGGRENDADSVSQFCDFPKRA